MLWFHPTHRRRPVPVADLVFDLPRLPVRVPAGFPSPADDFLDETLDVRAYLVRRPAATYAMEVDGDSMRDAGVLSGDVVLIDRAEEPKAGHMVIAVRHGDFTLKRLRRKRDGSYWLCPENRDRPELRPIRCEEDCEIWGVVVGVVRRYPA